MKKINEVSNLIINEKTERKKTIQALRNIADDLEKGCGGFDYLIGFDYLAACKYEK